MFGNISPPREVLPSIIIIIIIIQKERLHNAVYKFMKDGCHYVWRAQTALIRYAIIIIIIIIIIKR